MRKVLIIGNGFDKDLGLPTSYNEFMQDVECYKEHMYHPCTDKCQGRESQEEYSHNLFNYLADQRNEKKEYWGGIEESLFMLSQVERSRTVRPTNLIGEALADEINTGDEYVMASYAELKKALVTYLSKLDYKQIRKNSCAYILMKAFAQDRANKIFSFNYTSLENLGIEIHADVRHVHGSLKDGWIVFGFQDCAGRPGYEKMHKNKDPHWVDYHLSEELCNSDEIIFFGQSLADSDMWYFKDFFTKSSTGELGRKSISFYGYDSESLLTIKRRVAQVCNYKYLAQNNDLRYYSTKQ